MSMRVFWDVEGARVRGELAAASPRDAALRLASRGEQIAWLVEPTTGKLHIFKCERVEVEDSQRNEYMRRRNLSYRPVVSKRAYRNLRRPVERQELATVECEFADMMS